MLRRERRRRLLFYSFLFHTLSVRPTTSLFLSSFALPTLKAKQLNVWYVKTGPALWLQTVTAKYKGRPELSDNKSGRFKAWHQQHLKENYNKARTQTWKMEKHAEPICTKSLESKKCLKGNLVDLVQQCPRRFKPFQYLLKKCIWIIISIILDVHL